MNAPVHAKSYSLPFRSKLIDWIESTPQKSASLEQWAGMLNNLQGIRSEEIQRADLFDSPILVELINLARSMNSELATPPSTISKWELLYEAKENLSCCFPTIQSHWRQSYRPTLDVKTVHNTLPKNIEPRAKPFFDRAQTFYQHPSLGYWIIRTGYEDLMTVAPNWIILDPSGKLVLSHDRHRGWFPTAVEAFDEMHRVIHNRFDAFGKDNPATIFDQYSFLGGNNYQEWFVRLPNWPLEYRDNHFELDQLLIHIRTTERVDYDGRTLLMVEEIQSPWHADIRNNGAYTVKYELEEDGDLIADAPFGKEWHELAIKAVIWLAVQQGHNHIGFSTGKQQCQRWGELDGLMNLYDLDIPKCLKKVSTRFDCANDWATIVTRKPEGNIRYSKPDGWIVRDKDNNPVTAPLKNKEVALFYLNQRSTPVKEQIRMFSISPMLKLSMNAGDIPLFGW